MPRNPSKTRLDNDITKPSTTRPGDAPYDTTDPEEMATSVMPQPGAQALLEGRVNAVLPLPKPEVPARDSKNDRTESYEVTGPDGKPVKVKHNLETGETSAD